MDDMRMRFFILLFCTASFATGQTVRTVKIGDNAIDVYRLDEKQKSELAKEVLADYDKLEQALDAGNAKEAMQFYKMIDFRMGNEAPNMRYLRDELNTLSRNEARKEQAIRLEHLRQARQTARDENTAVNETDSLDYYLMPDISISFPHHQYGAKYIGSNYNRVASNLLNYIRKIMRWSLISDTSDNEGNVIWEFENNGLNVKPMSFKVKFYLEYPYDVRLMNIDKIEMAGNWEPLAELFRSYWPTNINFDDWRNEHTATRRFSSDYVKITRDYPLAKMTITSS